MPALMGASRGLNVASEETYRELARRYPSLTYQVARACAVAGYTNLYLNLDVLPEVSIAEEARDAGSHAIFAHIMAQPARYAVFDDYYRVINSPKTSKQAQLNGDTAVRSKVQRKQKFRLPSRLINAEGGSETDDDFLADVWELFGGDGYDEMMFNITEDQNIGESEVGIDPDPMLELLRSPLPHDLPAGDKDLLILMAAYYGDIDRYVRLRRPKMVKRRTSASSVVSTTTPSLQSGAHPDTYRALAGLQPEMHEACIRAAIYADYDKLFDELIADTEPNAFLISEARNSSNPKYLAALTARAKELGVDTSIIATLDKNPCCGWKMYSVRQSGPSMRRPNITVFS
ncbi:hypothetical protein AJ79_08548 [Helicocarpus griseus UAMH5409]|uniref:Uncharacterized protein n=1 Tax=Helicocarpus griseus UAMH5409 TaxID=1447875 RepID=A0A2B7WRT5_9EURO|nr:hypothetical protein AJ79_08548 [Helicocarpus griseus UAMH5409]